MSTRTHPNTSVDDSTCGSHAAAQRLLLLDRRLHELLAAVAPFVKLFDQAAEREDTPMPTNGTTEAVIANKDLRRLAYAADDAASTPQAIQWLLQNTTSPKDGQASEILQSLGWTCIGGQWSEDPAATATLALRGAAGQTDAVADVSNMVATEGHEAPGWTSEEIEEVIACLDDDAANMLAENPEDERAPIMQRAARMVQVFSMLATSASVHQETHRLQAGGAELQEEQEREELIRLRGEHPVAAAHGRSAGRCAHGGR